MQVPFRYIPRDTVVHRLHPLVKLAHVFLTLLLILAPIYDVEFLPVLLIWLGLTAALWVLARIEIRRFATLIKLLIGTFLFLMIAQGFTYRYGETTIIRLFDFEYGQSNIGEMTLEGVLLGFMLSVRILTAAASLPLLVMTTSSTALMAALRRLRVPKVATFMIVSALSFTTLIFEMWNHITEAQKLRGFDIDRMNPVVRLRRAYVPIVTPLLLLLFRKANEFQIALETKGFGAPGQPTEIELFPWRLMDTLALAVFVALFLVAQVLRIRIAAGLAG